jgi:hypothetical protein
MTVINLDEHRPKKVGPCRITFFSSRFGRDSAIEYNYDIENGDVMRQPGDRSKPPTGQQFQRA